MGRLMSMTDVQRAAVALIRAGAALRGVRKPTRDVLVREGFIAQADGAWRLTDAGEALFIEDAQRRNTAAQFREGDTVRWIDWESRLRPQDSPMVLCRVLKVTASRVRIVELASGVESTREPKSLVPAITGDDALFPVEDPEAVQAFIDSPAGHDVATLQRVVAELAEYARGLLLELAARPGITELGIYGGVEVPPDDMDDFDGLADFVPVWRKGQGR
jgi:hypothetical protein